MHVNVNEFNLSAALIVCCGGRPAQWLSSVIDHIGFSAPLKYLLVVLKPGFTGKQLAALNPDITAMAEALPASEITGVIIATIAGQGERSGIQTCADQGCGDSSEAVPAHNTGFVESPSVLPGHINCTTAKLASNPP